MVNRQTAFIYDDYNNRFPSDQDNIGTLTCNIGNSALKNGIKLVEVPCCLRYERTEYGKQIRKAYERGEISERRCNMRQYAFREDGCANTLTTVTKDNYIAVVEPEESF